MAKYDDLAIYDARVVITGIIDRLNLGLSVAERLVPNYAASEQGRLHRSTLDLWNDLFEVVDKWEARNGYVPANLPARGGYAAAFSGKFADYQ